MSKEKKIMSIILVMVFMLFTVCLNIPEAAADKTIKIGGIYPLTGYLAWLGEYYKKAAILKVDQINKSGGVNDHTLELVTYDDKSSPEEAVRLAKRLILKDKAIAIIGCATAPITASVASIVRKHKIPVVAASGYDVKPEKDHFIFNTAPQTYFAASRAFSYLKKEGTNRIAFLMAMGALGEVGIANGKKAAEKYGLTIIGTERFDTKAPEVTAQLAKLRALKPEAIFSFSTGKPAALVARNMAQMKFNVPLVVSHGNGIPGFLKLTSGLPTRIIVPSVKIMVCKSLSDDDPAKPILEKFNKEHINAYGEPANIISTSSADNISLVAEGIRLSSSTDPQKIRDGIEAIKNFVGLNGVYNLSSTDHYGTRIEDMILLTVKDGKWKKIE